MQAYTVNEKDSNKIEKILANLKEIVGKKLILLINHIFNNDKNQFFESLRINQDDPENISHFNLLNNKKEDIIRFPVEEVPNELLENFGQALLSTNELTIQINKLVFKNFG